VVVKTFGAKPNGEHMRRIFLNSVPAGIFLALLALALPSTLSAQTDVAKVYKTNCVLCHAADGSGNSPSGKALGAKDLASSEVQKKSDAELTEGITKGKGKMPAFGAKLKPDDIKQVVAYIRSMGKK
jgi:mono/diheme cytochrome c family protein